MQPDPTDLNEIATEDIAELAGVTSAAVSNWIKRELDFPEALRVVGRRTMYSRTAVMAWLERNDKLVTNDDGRWQGDLWRLADLARGAVRFTDLIEALAWTTAYLRDNESAPADDAKLIEHAVSADSVDNGLYLRLGAAETAPTLFRQIRSTAERLAEHGGAPLEHLVDLAVHRDRTFDGGASQLLLDDLIDAACIGDDGRVLDPAAGVGSLLRRINQRTGNDHLTGRFESLEAMRVAQAINAAQGIPVDTHLADATAVEPQGARFNRIVSVAVPVGKTNRHPSDPPAPADPRWQLAVPLSYNSWEASLQDALWNLAPDGVAVFAVSDHHLTSEAAAKVREQIVRTGVITTIIRTQHLLPGAKIGLSFLVARRLTQHSEGAILMVDLTGSAGNVHDASWEMWINGISNADDPRCAVVQVDELVENDSILDAGRYIRQPAQFAADAANLAAGLPRHISDADEQLELLGDIVQMVHIPSFDPSRNAWRSTSIANLADDKVIHIAIGRTRGSSSSGTGQLVLTPHELSGASGRSLTRCEPDDRSATQIVRTGDLIIQLDHHPGRSMVVTDEHDGWVLGAGLARIRPDRNGTTTEQGWLAAWTASPTFRADCERLSIGTSVPRLRLRDLRRIDIPIPPLEVQRAAAAYSQLIADLEAANRSARRAVDHLVELTTELLAAHLLEPLNPDTATHTPNTERLVVRRRSRSAAAERLHRGDLARVNLQLKPTQLEATGRLVGDKFEVDAGAQARADATASLSDSNRRLREQLTNSGLLVTRGDHLELIVSYLFDSPSAAASVLTGTSTNGTLAWVDDQGRTLKQLTQAHQGQR